MNQGRGRFGTKAKVGFINDDQTVAVVDDERLNLLARDSEPCWCVGVGQHYGQRRCFKRTEIDRKVRVNRHLVQIRTIQRCPDRIKTVGRIQRLHRPICQKRQPQVRQHLIRAIAHKNLIVVKPFNASNGCAQSCGCGIGIAAQLVGTDCSDSLHHGIRRRQRVLIGVEFDQRRGLRLLARHIWLQRLHLINPESTHRGHPVCSRAMLTAGIDKVRLHSANIKATKHPTRSNFPVRPSLLYRQEIPAEIHSLLPPCCRQKVLPHGKPPRA